MWRDWLISRCWWRPVKYSASTSHQQFEAAFPGLAGQQVTGEPHTAILVDLRTGKQTGVAVDGDPRFTRPNGKALLLASRGDSSHPFLLNRVDLAGKSQLTYPTDKLAGKFNGDYLPTPDGTRLVLGTATGLALMGNDGKPGPELSIAGQTDCNPLRWWDGSAGQTVLARCNVADSYVTRAVAGADRRRRADRVDRAE